MPCSCPKDRRQNNDFGKHLPSSLYHAYLSGRGWANNRSLIRMAREGMGEREL